MVRPHVLCAKCPLGWGMGGRGGFRKGLAGSQLSHLPLQCPPAAWCCTRAPTPAMATATCCHPTTVSSRPSFPRRWLRPPSNHGDRLPGAGPCLEPARPAWGGDRDICACETFTATGQQCALENCALVPTLLCQRQKGFQGSLTPGGLIPSTRGDCGELGSRARHRRDCS